MRNLIDIIRLVEAHTVPVSVKQVVTPEWIDEILTKGFDVGLPHEASSLSKLGIDLRYDMEAVGEMLNHFQDYGEIPDSIDPYNLTASDMERVRPVVARWATGRFSQIVADMSPRIQTLNGGIKVERAITVLPDVVARVAAGEVALGEFWSFDYGNPFWNDKATGKDLVMVASVAAGAIDWITTVRRNMHYSLGEDETEIFLPRGTPVSLYSLEYDNAEVPVTGRAFRT